jgi:hypothetical protein
MNCFIPEFLAKRARDLREQFGAKSRGVPLRETPGSVLQWSTTTKGAERFVSHKPRSN